MSKRCPSLAWLCLTATVLMVLAPLTSASAEASAGRLSGLVEDQDGHALAAAEVRLTDPSSGSLVASVTTDGVNAPVQSLVPDGDGDGYWLVAADGGVF